MSELKIWKQWLRSHWDSRSTRHNERGDITQVVIIVALFAAAAIAISAIIIAKFTAKAQTTPTQ